MKPSIAFGFGLLFGLGLLLSGMTSPDKVTGFLDVTGAWDPSLAFVMGGAVLTAAPLFARKRRAGAGEPVAGSAAIDGRLLVGAAIFGIGWGLAGICPGPALVNIAIAPVVVLPFVAAMLAGLFVARLFGGSSDA